MTTIEPSWRPDPSGRHQHRYWDGSSWTDAVADNGVQSIDPLGQPPLVGEATAPISMVPGAMPGPVAPTSTAWYEQTWFIVLALVFCFPVGLIFVWRKPWQQGVKIAITASVGILFIGMMVAAALSPKKESTNAASRVASTSAPATAAPPTTLSPAARARQQAAAKATAAKAAAAAAAQARQQAAATAAAAKRAAAARQAAALKAAAAAQAAAAARAAAAAAAQAAYLKAHTPVVLWQQSGSGIQSGQQFTVPDGVKGWNEVWSYNCSGFGSRGNFITTINGSSSDTGNNQLGPGGSGTNYYYDTGTFSIDVNSECDWTDEAVTVP
jgi:hypothetical protein